MSYPNGDQKLFWNESEKTKEAMAEDNTKAKKQPGHLHHNCLSCQRKEEQPKGLSSWLVQVVHPSTSPPPLAMFEDCLDLYGITDQLRLEGSSRGHQVKPPCSRRANQSWLPRIMSRWLLSIFRGGDSRDFQDNLCQHSNMSIICNWNLYERYFLVFKINLWYMII